MPPKLKKSEKIHEMPLQVTELINCRDGSRAQAHADKD
jgi:hypothetical protein